MAYLCQMWTSWALVVDVWYLPPATREPHENSTMFANRVKADIARQAGLTDLMWVYRRLFYSSCQLWFVIYMFI